MHVLMDTGPWVALIARSEGRHEKCVKWFRQFKGEIFTSEAALTEVLYLLNFSTSAQSAAFDFGQDRGTFVQKLLHRLFPYVRPTSCNDGSFILV